MAQGREGGGFQNVMKLFDKALFYNPFITRIQSSSYIHKAPKSNKGDQSEDLNSTVDNFEINLYVDLVSARCRSMSGSGFFRDFGQAFSFQTLRYYEPLISSFYVLIATVRFLLDLPLRMSTIFIATFGKL